MSIIAAGSRLVLRTAHGPVPLRALARVEMAGDWRLPVLAPLRALTEGEGTLEVATATGLLSVSAHLRLTDDGLALHAGSGQTPALQQRRQDVRGRLVLPLRARAADVASERALIDAVVEGVTLDVSAGGLGVDLHPRSGATPCGVRLYVELSLPSDRLVPAVLSVVELSDRRLHGRFVDIAPADREHLVHLVFVAQRHELAGRLRSPQPSHGPRRGPVRQHGRSVGSP